MPFIANTPESFVGRSDSKNPATTCRGITSGGRPCRRSISTARLDQKGLAGSRTLGGRLHVHDDALDENSYCWQHKEQAAAMSTHSSPEPQRSTTRILEERTSLDTLADRLHLLSTRPAARLPRSSGSLGEDWAKPPRPKPPAARPALLCCCFRTPPDDVPSPPPWPRPRPVQPSRPRVQDARSQMPSSSSPGRPTGSRRPSAASQVAQYLSLIPPTTSPQTTSALMAELAKPVSENDEPGYIYMFWLTPGPVQSVPSTATALSLLSPPPCASGSSSPRRAGHSVASFATGNASCRGSSRTVTDSQASSNTLLLKIGRANNVQRRLNEWTRQCGYNLSLIRYYPYISSKAISPGSPTAAVPRKLPHSHKVERLIHIELVGAGLRLDETTRCDACGKEHREWFQVEASRKAVATVDEVIRRWADWDESFI